MSTEDQNLTLPSAGQSDWDTDLNSNFTIIGRGYHVLGQAGLDVATGVVVTIDSGGFFRPFDPNSTAIRPHAFAYKAVDSGEQDTFLLSGIVRSIAINSPVVPGEPVFASANGSGFLVGSYSGASRPVGFGTEEDGLFFAPGREIFPETLTRSVEINAVTGSSHLFTMDGGRGGFVRQLIADGASGDLVEIQLWSNSARSSKLFETFSGGINVISSFLDQAGFPYWNTDASTINGLIYGTLQVMSAASVSSDDVTVQCVFERFR
jgi:hypothetical protein